MLTKSTYSYYEASQQAEELYRPKSEKDGFALPEVIGEQRMATSRVAERG